MCTEDGTEEYWECAVCGAIFADADGTEALDEPVAVPATGHDWDDGTVVTEADCTTEGEVLYICRNDASHTKTETLPALGHSYSEAWESGADGHWHICTRCGQADGAQPHVSDGSATESEPEVCSVCRYEISPALGHIHAQHLTYVAARAATCTQTGNIAYYQCSCGARFPDADAQNGVLSDSAIVIPALGHSYSEAWESGDTGHWHVCTRCGRAGTVYPHTYETDADEGMDRVCSVCRYVIRTAVSLLEAHAYFESTGGSVIPAAAFRQSTAADDMWEVTLPDADSTYDQFFEGWQCSQDGMEYLPGTILRYAYTNADSVTFTGLWTQILHAGTYSLSPAVRYRLAAGSYTVEGDATSYAGDRVVYAVSGGTYTLIAEG